MDILVENGSGFQGPNTTNSPTIYIIDRSFDVVAPVVHEFTYQAMMHDLLNVNDGKYSRTTEAEGEKKKTTATLDEYDPIWV